MDDTISRAAAIDALNRLEYTPGEWATNGLTMCKDAIKALPSATDTNVGGNLIDRQAAIDALWEALYEYEDKTEKQFQESEDLDVGDWIEHRIFVQNMNDIDRQTILNLPSAQPGWIPCDRELPKPNEEDGNGFYKAYLVQDGRWMDVARWNGKYWIAWGYSTVLLNVVAWMPLPAPYIPEGDDKHEG